LTSGSVIPVTRARVTPISRYPVTCVTEGGRKDLVTPKNAITPNSRAGARTIVHSSATTARYDRIGPIRRMVTVTNRVTAVSPATDLARLCVPCASQPSGTEAERSHKPLRHSETRRRRHLFDDHKGVFARANSNASTSSRRPARAAVPIRARGPGARRNGDGNFINRAWKRLGWWWVAVETKPGSKYRHPLPISRPSFKNLFPFRHKDRCRFFGAAFPENIQMTMNDGALIETRPCESNDPSSAK
jgi:hypothetical protein